MNDQVQVLLVAGLILVSSGCHSSRSPAPPVLSEKAKTQLSQQVLTEMMHVIYSRDEIPSAEYQDWLNVLVQGASLEGVYRGMVLSREYRRLELDGPPASLAARDAFVREVKELGYSLDTSNEKQLEQASIYALKKRLGDFALQKMDQLSSSTGSRALRKWFSQWAVQKSSQGVDFGVRERMSTDSAQMLKQMEFLSDDRLRWEVLTRLHRIMNQAQRNQK